MPPTWSMKLGGALNRCIAQVALSARGAARVSWTAALPERSAQDIVTDGERRAFVTSGRRLLAFARDRSVWSIDTEAEFGDLVVLPDGLLVVEVGRQLMMLDPATGAVRWSLAGYWSKGRPLVTPDGRISHSMKIDGRWHFTLLTRDGSILWSRAFTFTGDGLAIDELLLLPMRSSLDAFDLDGNPRWRATPQGFFEPAAPLPPDDDDGLNFSCPADPVCVGDHRIMCGWQSPDGLPLVLDIRNRALEVWPNRGPARLPPRLHPLAHVVRPGRPNAIASFLTNTLLAVDEHGEQWLNVPLLASPAALLVDQAGTVVVSFSESIDYWDKYVKYYDLTGRTGVLGFDADGRERFAWIPPGPLSPPLAASADGEVLVACEGKLWALA